MKTFPAPVAAVALAAVVAAGAAMAQPPAPNRDPAQVQPGAYKVEPAHTRILFSVSHMGFTDYFGQFNGASGKLELNPANPAASSVSVSIPTDSVDANNSVLTGELKSPEWFDAAKFPTITFTSTKVTPTGKDTARIDGDLTFHGVTRPVSLEAKFNASGPNPLNKKYTVGFNAKGQLKRSEFGQKTYVPLIGDEVTLTISAAFEKAS
jgi:polyisoprenoid-binding protein YceI